MQKNDCSKQKIIGAYYSKTSDKNISEHIGSCAECSKYYQDLSETGERLNILKSMDDSVNNAAVKRIVNIHLSVKERKKAIRETIVFGAISFVLLAAVYGTAVTFYFKAALVFYLILFINLPVLLLPAILKRKELI